jgi:hypothetical protein
MTTPLPATALLLSLALVLPGAAAAAEDPALLKDLTAVLQLLGMPCGQVTGVRRQADNDHFATCRNGRTYRVFVNSDGRAVAQRQFPPRSGRPTSAGPAPA